MGCVAQAGIALTISVMSLGPHCDQYGPSQRQIRIPVRYVVKAGSGIVKSNVPCAGLSEAWFSWPSPIVLSPVEGIISTELIRTSDTSWRLTQGMSFTFGEQDSTIGLMEKDATAGSSLIACSLKGRFLAPARATATPEAGSYSYRTQISYGGGLGLEFRP